MPVERNPDTLKECSRFDRRTFVSLFGAAAAGAALAPNPLAAQAPSPITRLIPSTGERLPVIGMGSWITFHVGDNADERAVRVEILRQFFSRGGALIDSSPMYGLSEEVIGHCLERLGNPGALFSATKVWTLGELLGISQMKHSEYLWGGDGFDLMQIHNLVDWQTHLKTLLRWKEEGRIRYIGVTTSHGRRHDELEQIVKSEPIDFVQLTYNIIDRQAENRLLPAAADRAVAVIVNRPFRRGALPDRLKGKPLPAWAVEFGCENWPQFLLKFIVSHPHVTCAIPSTSRVDHMMENMGANFGRLPDMQTRRRMIRYVEEVI
ncbi:MAG TPA: aldo/keto reductase [Gammaproteobacteria bacterium]|nr:aldo/keto reductase [Gammaproteobacteria bacterium]